MRTLLVIQNPQDYGVRSITPRFGPENYISPMDSEYSTIQPGVAMISQPTRTPIRGNVMIQEILPVSTDHVPSSVTIEGLKPSEVAEAKKDAEIPVLVVSKKETMTDNHKLILGITAFIGVVIMIKVLS